MPACGIFDVDIRDADRYRDFRAGVKPEREKAGGTYLARGGDRKVY